MMLRRISGLRGLFPSHATCRYISSDSRDERQLLGELRLPGIQLDEIDELLSNLYVENHYPNLDIKSGASRKPFSGHNLMVVQPWIKWASFDGSTDPRIQLEECVSLGNTIHNWNVVDKRIIFARSFNRKCLFGTKTFEQLKGSILSQQQISAVFFGVELLSGIQLSSLENELKMPVYDRFTIVLNIFRQHARTKEAKIQLALAELPYIRSHLREIHESSENSSSSESLKFLIGGAGERFYLQRLNILKRRESRLRSILDDLRKQRHVTKRLRKKSDIPVVSVVGYTNSGKTSLIKYLTEDERLVPEDKLFATLDVTVHSGQLPSNKVVLYVDTVGFISRIPLLLIEAFSATLNEIQESDLIVHILDVTHPDHILQNQTVIKALQALKIPKHLIDSKITVGNKCDKLNGEESAETVPKCDLLVSVTENIGLTDLVSKINSSIVDNLNHSGVTMRIQNGGAEYSWLRKNATITRCEADEADANYLICQVMMSPMALGRWRKMFGSRSLVNSQA